jgi:hypothetical protein
MLYKRIAKIKFVFLMTILTGLNYIGVCQGDSLGYYYKDSIYWMRYERYNPFVWLNMASIPMRVTKTRTDCLEIVEYSRQGVSGPKSNRIILTFNRCSPSLSRYESKIVYFEPFFPKTPEFSAKLEFIDSLDFSYLEKNYTIKKYKAEMLKGEYITLYYNDSIGIIKQYGSYRSIEEDNIEIKFITLDDPRTDLAQAFLSAIRNNNAFHERYDFGPRIIQREIIDKKLFKKTKRLYKKKGYI